MKPLKEQSEGIVFTPSVEREALEIRLNCYMTKPDSLNKTQLKGPWRAQMRSQENHYNGCCEDPGETQGLFSLKHEAGVLRERRLRCFGDARLKPVSCQLYSKKLDRNNNKTQEVQFNSNFGKKRKTAGVACSIEDALGVSGCIGQATGRGLPVNITMRPDQREGGARAEAGAQTTRAGRAVEGRRSPAWSLACRPPSPPSSGSLPLLWLCTGY